MLDQIMNNINVEELLLTILKDIHKDGPIDAKKFEELAYIKKFHSEIFIKYEKKLLFLMGLFYKVDAPENLLEEVYSIYADAIRDETNKNFTPVQAHAFRNIHDQRYFSFSAPTSAGKSFLFREIIQDAQADIVIIVPSRALIAEYITIIYELVDKTVLVLPFVDNINIAKTTRRIFILTPERAVDLFKQIHNFSIELFLFDEAQISEEEVRGLKFDALIRRIDRILPDAKKNFTHPFIDNPGAQLLKHNFSLNALSYKYEQHTVGKIFSSIRRGQFSLFSPYKNQENKEIKKLEIDPVDEVLQAGGTLLVFISKNKIYNGEYITEFSKYIEKCPKIENISALHLIDELRLFIGADNTEKTSLMIKMMEKGIVIHHGSMPLRARLLVEDFIRSGFAHICFATSTLNQGINMPFDVVWIDNFTRMDSLTIKNLIGRSGRTTSRKNTFEFGYTIVKESNVSTFSKRLGESILLKESSLIDEDISSISDDLKDIVEAIKTDSFNDDLHLTESQVERLSGDSLHSDIKYILENILKDGQPITGSDYYALNDTRRNSVKLSFKNIYIKHLRKNSLTSAETAVLSASIPIMLWHIQGKSFSEIISLRYAFLTEKDTRRKILKEYKDGAITSRQANMKIDLIPIRYTPAPSTLPNSSLRAVGLFEKGATVNEFDYDLLVYDTYDYLDKVVSLSLSDPLCAAFQLYFNVTGDNRALVMRNYIRYGTNDDKEIWLLRYGIGFENIGLLKEHIEFIDENEIIFKHSFQYLAQEDIENIKRYI